MRPYVIRLFLMRLVLPTVLAAALLASTTASAATYVVTNLNDDGPGSFRRALNDARSSGDIIDFAVTGTIVLTTFSLGSATDGLTIQGPGADRLAISGNGLMRVFYFSEARVTMSGLTIRDGNTNNAPVFNTRGAGIYNESLLTLNDCVITNNNGGGIHSAVLEMNRCTISNNTVANDSEVSGGSRGAAIVNDGTLTISNSTIANNEAVNGAGTTLEGAAVTGGILNHGATLNVIGCTISGNTVSGGSGFPAGGGIVNFSTTSAPTVTDTIIAGNTSPMGPDCFGSFTSGGYNLIGDSAASNGFAQGVNHDQVGGAGSSVIDARLGTLGDNGGPTLTMAPLPGSPALDQGLSSLPTDQRGAARRVDFEGTPDAEGGDGSDVGAFESRPIRIKSIAKSGSTVTVSLDAIAGLSTFQLQRSLSLAPATYSDIGSPQTFTAGDLVTLRDPTATESSVFYRVTGR